ncbi:hypothetical protein [Mycoplasma tauri]|uniref:hypothetical protein n=1 Tax=Mycoplasma tauri TaxID=547987 RepID=UPI001CBA92FA|nr:hypothetical protein [Mycoplasma tauri]MBZ4217983.1 hypothetical protein [Mycoplasma tauri]
MNSSKNEDLLNSIVESYSEESLFKSLTNKYPEFNNHYKLFNHICPDVNLFESFDDQIFKSLKNKKIEFDKKIHTIDKSEIEKHIIIMRSLQYKRELTLEPECQAKILSFSSNELDSLLNLETLDNDNLDDSSFQINNPSILYTNTIEVEAQTVDFNILRVKHKNKK